MKYSAIATALLLAVSTEAQTQSAELSSSGQRFILEAEDQFGDPVHLPADNGKPYLVFFLPKVEEDLAQQSLKQVETSFQELEENYTDQVGRLFVVVPFRSGRIVNFMMSRRLRNKDFRVVTDDDGKIMEALSPKSDDLFFCIVAPDGEVTYRSDIAFTEHDWAAGREWLDEKLTE